MNDTTDAGAHQLTLKPCISVIDLPLSPGVTCCPFTLLFLPTSPTSKSSKLQNSAVLLIAEHLKTEWNLRNEFCHSSLFTDEAERAKWYLTKCT